MITRRFEHGVVGARAVLAAFASPFSAGADDTVRAALRVRAQRDALLLSAAGLAEET